MKLKKMLSMAMAVVMTTAMAAGCGSASSESTQTTEAPSATTEKAAAQTDVTQAASSGDEVTIRVALWDYSNTEYYKTMFDAFSTAYPSIKYEVVEFPADEYPTTIKTQLMGGQNFDVVFLKDLPTMSALIAGGHLMALDSFMEGDTEFDKANYSGLIEQLVVDGASYGVPFRKDNNMIFYNKDIFDAAGVAYPEDGMTMADYEALAEKLTSGEGNDKVYGAHMHTWASNASMYARRGEEFNQLDTSTYMSLLPYYQTMLDMQDKGYIQDYGALKSGNIHYSGVMYNHQAAMLQMGSWFINMLVENADFNWGVCSLPSEIGLKNEIAVGGITPVTIGAYATHPQEAWTFIKYVCGEEGAKVLAGTGIVPGFGSDAINSIFDSLHETSSFAPEGLSKYINIDTYVVEFPMAANAGDIDTIIGEEHSAIMTKTITPEEGIQNMIDRINALQ